MLDVMDKPMPTVQAGRPVYVRTEESGVALKFKVENCSGFAGEGKIYDVEDGPVPCVQAGGVAGDNISHYCLYDDGEPARRRAADPGKPPYRVPSMAEIDAVPRSGLTVISTFSGCGGTCLGYRMAGYDVLWASEFVRAARESYLANYPETPVDPRDIREVDPVDILRRIGKQRGEVDVLEGSPPCAAFSTAGKRHRGWGQVRNYSDTRQRTDDLFGEFARILNGIQPKVFAAENVSGLVKGVAKGYFIEVLNALKGCGYVVKAKLLDAQWLGVPQARQRIFFVGVRKDLGLEPAFPAPLPYRYSLVEACPWIVKARWDSCGQYGSQDFSDGPIRTIEAGGGRSQLRYVVEAEADISRFAVGAEAARLAEGEQSDRFFSLQRAHRERPSPTVTAEGGNPSIAAVVHPTEARKFTIAELKRVCSFPDDFELTGTYAQQWERLGRSVPPLMARAVAVAIRDLILLPCQRS